MIDTLSAFTVASPETVPPTREPLVEVEGLYKSFGDNHVLRGINLTVYREENLVVLGRSGSGKSVLIKCISGLLPIDAGKVRLFGKSIPDMSHHELDHLRSRVGFLFQNSALYDSMTVRENLEFPLRRHQIMLSADEINARVEEALEQVGLPEAIDMMPAELSGGMRKRIGLARALMLRPEIILYDEPTAGLDPITAKEISYLIVKVQKRYKAAAIVITHDMNCVHITANRVILLLNGVAYASGTYDELARSEDPQIKGFFTVE